MMTREFTKTVVLIGCYLLVFSLPDAWTGFECLRNPCLYGICIDDINSNPHQCYCVDGFTGYSCQINWNECNSQPCLNGGECIDGIASFNCTCPENFAGTQCEYDLTECDAFMPCLNNGTCSFNPQLIEPGKNGSGFYCSCPGGFSGPQCEDDVSICNSTQNVCLNGGKCRDGIGEKFYCECLPGFTGSTCEHDIDDCHSQPCQNGGVCVDRVNDFNCACPFGHTGRLCETKLQICEDNPCKNGAFCLQEDGIPVCYCVPDFHGKLCEERYDECAPNRNDSEPKCYNGGTCIDGVGEFTCSCPPGFFGPTCQCTEFNRTDPECQDTRGNVTISSTIPVTGFVSPTWFIPTPTLTLTTVDLSGAFSPTMSDFPDISSTISPSLGFSTDFIDGSNELTTTMLDSTEDFATATMESTFPPFSDLTPTPTTPWIPADDTETLSPSNSLLPPWVTTTAYPENSTWLDYSSPTVTDDSSTTFLSPTQPESTISYEPTSTTLLISESTAAFPEESASETGSYSVDITPTVEIETVSMTPTPSDSSSIFQSESIVPSETLPGPFETVTPPIVVNETTTEGPEIVNATSTEEPSVNTTITEEPSVNTTITEGPMFNTTTTEEPLANGTSTEAPFANVTITEEPLVNVTSTEETANMTFWPITTSTTSESPLNHTLPVEPEPVTRPSTEPPLENTTVSEVFVTVTSTESSVTVNVTISEGPVTRNISSSTEPAVTVNATQPMKPEPGTQTGTEDPESRTVTSSDDGNSTESVTPTTTRTTDDVTKFPPFTQQSGPTSPSPTTATPTDGAITEPVATPTGEPTTTPMPEIEINDTDSCSNYCQNNAKCVSTSIEPICICPFKYIGKQCEIAKEKIRVPSFKGNSFLKYKLPSESVRVVDVSLKMATIVPEGVILYTASVGVDQLAKNISYALIFIQNGHLVLHFSCGSHSMEFVETRNRVNNGYNFTLDFRMETVINGLTNELHCVGKLSVNQSFVMSGEQLVGKGSLPLFENIYVGGVEHRVAKSSGNSDIATFMPGLRGCIYTLLVNQEEQDMYDQAMDGKEIGECETFSCVINPCFGNAKCVPTNKLPYWECLCPTGYEGARCQIEKCESDPCSNGGTCTPSPLLRSFPNNTQKLACLCPLGFSGLRCENRITINKPSFHPTLAFSSYMSYYGIPRFEDWFQMKFHFVTTNFTQISVLMFIGNTKDSTSSHSHTNLADSESEEQIESPLTIPIHEESREEDSFDKVLDFFSISFLQGYIAITWNLGSGTQRVITPSPVDHRLNIHTLFVGREGRQAWLKVDGMRNTTGKSAGPLYRLNTDSDLYIGGYESFQFEGLPHDLPLHTGFQGCIFDLGFRVKNKLYLPKSFRETESVEPSNRNVNFVSNRPLLQN